MKIKVTLGTMQNASKLVSIAESISCDVDLCYGRYIVDAKSMLGVLSLPILHMENCRFQLRRKRKRGGF